MNRKSTCLYYRLTLVGRYATVLFATIRTYKMSACPHTKQQPVSQRVHDDNTGMRSFYALLFHRGCQNTLCIKYHYLLLLIPWICFSLIAYTSFCPQFGQNFAPSVLAPQFGQKFGFAPPVGATLPEDWFKLFII